VPSDSERIAELERIVTELQAVIGDYKNKADMSKPPAELPNGEYTIMFRQKQLGYGADAAVRLAAAADDKADEAKAEVAVLRAQIQEPTSTADLPQVIDHDVVFMGRVGIGGILPDGRAQLHIMDNRSASILFVSNMDKAQYQGASQHVAELSLSDDSGFRKFKNAMTTISTRPETDPDTGVTYQSMMKYGVDPTKPYLIDGCDSQGQPSWDHRYHTKWLTDRGLPANFYDRTQTVVWVFDPTQKLVRPECWQRGWRFKFGAEAKYGPGVWTGAMP
jgi:hypothetical protein